MRVAIAGAHGKIAMRLAGLLADRGDAVLGLIRNRAHAEEVRATGADPVVCDLESATIEQIAAAVAGTDAVVFAAGAGPGSSAERKLTMDRDGAIKLLGATTNAQGYLMISAVGAEDPPDGDDVFSVYLRAKAQADAALIATERDWTIVRPGRLTDDPGTGRVRIDSSPFRGEVPREDVAAVLAGLLHDRRALRRVLYVNAGPEPVDQALESSLPERPGT
ncbi:MAG: SDR family oxidoreductase [Actinomycetota bacterium]|nr:SDR family oxidoreductase [Actinomycetota bacterium]